MTHPTHDLYKDGDDNIPNVIRDKNGQHESRTEAQPLRPKVKTYPAHGSGFITFYAIPETNALFEKLEAELSRLNEKNQIKLNQDDAQNLRYATQIAAYLHQNFYPEVTQWKPFAGDLFGVLMQIDNMVTGLQRKSSPSTSVSAPQNGSNYGFTEELCGCGHQMHEGNTCHHPVDSEICGCVYRAFMKKYYP